MKNYYHESFKATTTDGRCSLPERYDTLERARNAIIDATERETAAGYKPLKYIIVKITTTRIFDDNGEFISEATITARI